MAGVPWTPAEDDLLRALNSQGLLAREIADRMDGRTRAAILQRRNMLGLSVPDGGARRTELWVSELEERLGEPIDAWLKRGYVDEKATYRELTNEMNINTRSLMKLLRMCNIEAIDQKEAVRRQMENDPEFVERLVTAGSSKEAARKRALNRQKNWCTRFSNMEHAFLKALNAAGYFPVPELAVETFNIDFAFPDEKLAVEYDPRWHKSERKRLMDERKEETLSALGWKVLRLDPRTSDEFNIQKISEALKLRASIHPR